MKPRKVIAKQERLKMPRSAPLRKDGIFKRKDSRFWQVRVWVDGKAYRRSTGKTDSWSAQKIIPLFRAALGARFHRERAAAAAVTPSPTEQPELLTLSLP